MGGGFTVPWKEEVLMRLVICDGFQYDADHLPRHVDAARCVPADEWYRTNSTSQPTPEPQQPPKPRRSK